MAYVESSTERILREEEIRGERIANIFRVCLLPVYGALVYMYWRTTGLFTITQLLTVVMIGVHAAYAMGHWYVVRRGLYRPWIKYVSVTVDVLAVVVVLLGYRLNTPDMQPVLFSAMQVMVFFLYITLTGLRFSRGASVLAGTLACLGYLAVAFLPMTYPGLVNPLIDTPFRYVAPGGAEHVFRASVIHEVGKALILLGAGLAAAYVSRTARRFLVRAVREKDEKNILLMKSKLSGLAEREAKKYLENVTEGLLSFGRNLVIKEQYSLATREIFGQRRVDGVRFPDFVYGDGEDEAKRELEEFLAIAFDNLSAEFSMIEEVNPLKRFEYHPGHGEVRHLAIGFKRVMEGPRVVELMATVDDITDQVRTELALAVEREKRQQETEQIAAILRLTLEDFETFTDESRSMLAVAIGRLEGLDVSADPGADIDAVFRAVHTLKGGARNYQFLTLARRAHIAEELLVVLREGQGNRAPDMEAEVIEALRKLAAAYDELVALGAKFKEFSQSKAFNAGSEDARLDAFVTTLHDLVGEMASSLHKQLVLGTEIELRPVPAGFTAVVRNPLLHLVRNAADHGIEVPAERERAGKAPAGQLKVAVGERGDDYAVSVLDDGGGIDAPAVVANARAKGLAVKDGAPAMAEAVRLLFSPGFSTKDAASEFSGRGVGLDAVKAMVTERGGRITVKSVPGRGTEFTLLYPKSSF